MQSFDKNGMFDWNQDGKVDMEDYAYYFCFIDDEDEDNNRESSSHARKSEPSYLDSMSKGEEQFFTALGTIVVFLFILWIIFG